MVVRLVLEPNAHFCTCWVRMSAPQGARLEDSVLIVLVVEDEPTIQQLAEDSLSEGGFKVEVAASGKQAIQLLDVPDPTYRAIVTDVNLGPDGVTGWEVARRAREVFSNIPVVYMTGNSSEEWTSQGVPNSVLLTKPFVPAQLLTAVSQLLNASPPPTDG